MLGGCCDEYNIETPRVRNKLLPYAHMALSYSIIKRLGARVKIPELELVPMVSVAFGVWAPADCHSAGRVWLMRKEIRPVTFDEAGVTYTGPRESVVENTNFARNSPLVVPTAR